MTLEQRVTALEELIKNGDERIRKIVNEEIKRSEQKTATAICHPKLLKVLQQEFPCLQCDSPE